MTAGLRVDGNSAFGDNFGLQKYPKVSASWVLSDYDWFPTDVFETFKLRGAIGESGKAPELRSPTCARGAGSASRAIRASRRTLRATRTWARSGRGRLEFGFDLSALDGRIGIETTHYKAKTTDALVGIDLPSSLGFLQNRHDERGRAAEQRLGVPVDRRAAAVQCHRVAGARQHVLPGLQGAAGGRGSGHRPRELHLRGSVLEHLRGRAACRCSAPSGS